MKLTVGDRVRVYKEFPSVGVVYEVRGNNIYTVTDDLGRCWFAHEKQCRKLIKKKKSKRAV